MNKETEKTEKTEKREPVKGLKKLRKHNEGGKKYYCENCKCDRRNPCTCQKKQIA